MTKIAEAKIERINSELIGVNAVTQNGIYSDAYLNRLNELYPLLEIIGKRRQGIIDSDWSSIAHFVMGTPLQNTEAEGTLVQILFASAKPGIWQPWTIRKHRNKLIGNIDEYIDSIRNTSKVPGYVDQGDLYGITRAEKGGFVRLTKFEKSAIVLPTQDFVEYCASISNQ